MHDPGEDSRRQYVGPPGDAFPAGVLGDPALHEIAGRIPRRYSRGGNVGNPPERMPRGKPFRAGRGRGPARRWIADKLTGELDLSAGDGRASLCVTRPTLPHSEPEIGGDPPDQRMTIERAGGERLERISPQAGQQ